MKKSWLNMESSNMNADGLREVVWEKDEIAMRRPSSASTAATKNNKRSKLSAATATTLHHNNELFPEVYHHHHQYVISDRSEKSGKEMTRPLAADSHLVPDNDDEQHDEPPEFMGNYLMISSSASDHHEIPPTTTKLVRSSHHHHHVNSDDDHGQIDEYYCKNMKTSSGTSKKKGTSNRAAGLLHFVTHFSRAHDDGRPAVVATTAFNSTPKTTCKTTALLVPTNDHHSQPPHNSWPNLNPNSKTLKVKAPSTSTSTAKTKLVETNYCCNEALVPSFSVCSNDVPSVSLVRTTTPYHQQPNSTTPDHSPCPSNSIEAEDEPPRPNYKAPPRAAQRKGRTTAVHNSSERRRRDKINKKMRALQALIPNCNKVNKASILDEAIEYMKTLQLQLQMMSMGTGVMPPNPMMLGSGAPPHLRTTFALPPPTFQMLGFPPPLPPAPFLPLNIAPSLPLVSPPISLSFSSSNNSKPTQS